MSDPWFKNNYGMNARNVMENNSESNNQSKEQPVEQSHGCAVDRPLRLRPITDTDLTRTANENYQLGRRHGKEEMLDERDTLIYWLLRAYQSGQRKGWEEGPSWEETMNGLLDVLANAGYDPNIGDAARKLIARVSDKRFASKSDTNTLASDGTTAT